MNKYLVEFLGSLFTTYIVLVSKNNWFASGASLAFAMLLGGYFSLTAAYNPAIAMVLYAAGKIDKNEIIPFIAAEFFGSLAAFYCF